jgi:hypothetical protein
MDWEVKRALLIEEHNALVTRINQAENELAGMKEQAAGLRGAVALATEAVEEGKKKELEDDLDGNDDHGGSE